MNVEAQHSALNGKRIVILIGSFARGGCERQAFLLSRELREQYGLDAQVWALFGAEWHPGDYRSDFEAAGIPTKVLHFALPRYGWVQRCLPIVRELRRNAVNVLLPFTTWPNVVAGLSYRFAGIQVCIWGERSAGSERIPAIERLAVKQYRQFAANSTAGVEFLVREMRVPRERIVFVPNGVEEPAISADSRWRERLGLQPNQLLVVKVANLTGFKDHATLLRAWNMVQKQWTEPHPPCLALAGHHSDADILDDCRRIVREGGAESTVRFLGSISDVPPLVHECDLTVFSSPKEGMPNVVLEYMAAGKAMVASDLPGVRDVMGENGVEMLVPPGDDAAFAERLLWLLRNPAKRLEFGKANLIRVRTEFSVRRMAQRHLNILESNAPAGWRQKNSSQLHGSMEIQKDSSLRSSRTHAE